MLWAQLFVRNKFRLRYLCSEGNETIVNLQSLIEKNSIKLYEVHANVNEFQPLEDNEIWGSMLVHKNL